MLNDRYVKAARVKIMQQCLVHIYKYNIYIYVCTYVHLDGATGLLHLLRLFQSSFKYLAERHWAIALKTLRYIQIFEDKSVTIVTCVPIMDL